MKFLAKKLNVFVGNLLKVFIGFQCLIIIFVTILLPCSPILITALFLKKLEAFVYRNFYNASTIPNSDRKTFMTDRIILIVLNGRFPLKELRQLFIRNVLDLHSKDGVLVFPNVTRCIKYGFFSEYWVDEKCFNICDHVKSFKDGNDEEYSVHDLPKLLSSIQKEKNEDADGSSLSPWSIRTANLINNRSAIMFKINVSLDDIEIVHALLSNEINPYQAKRVKVDTSDNDVSIMAVIKDTGFAGWLLFTVAMERLTHMAFTMRSMRKNIKKSYDKKVYFCSKNVNSSTYQQIGHQIGVSSRYVVLANVTMAMQGVFPYHSYTLTNYEHGVNTHQVTVELPFSTDEKLPKLRKDDIKQLVLNFKLNASLDPACPERMLIIFISNFSHLFLPTFLLTLFTGFCNSNPVKVDLNIFEMDGKDRILGRAIQNFSVWNQGSTYEKLKITITDCTNSLVISTVSRQSMENISLKFLKRFHELHCQMSEEAGLVGGNGKK